MAELARPRRILVVEDDDVLRRRLARAFRERGFEVGEAKSAAAAEREATVAPDYAVVDLRLEDSSGLDVVRALLAARPDLSVVVLTGYGSIATALEAVRLGARHYLTKPADVDAILGALSREGRARPRPRSRHRVLPAWSGSTSTPTTRRACLVSRSPEWTTSTPTLQRRVRCASAWSPRSRNALAEARSAQSRAELITRRPCLTPFNPRRWSAKCRSSGAFPRSARTSRQSRSSRWTCSVDRTRA
jgi:ActR/RegA family two-component response regulator